MNLTTEDPIHIKWSSCESDEWVSAHRVVDELATLEVHQLADSITPYLAAASAEIASIADIRWRFSADDATVALLRILSRGALVKPDAKGPHIQRLFEQLSESSTTL